MQQKGCYCNSKTLYQSDYTNPHATFLVDGKQYQSRRKVFTMTQEQQQKKTHQYEKLSNDPVYQSLVESSELWLPSQIEKICWDEIQFNPLWFYKKYISKNVPCIITDMYQGDDIFQRWSDPQYLRQATTGYDGISMSLTPDGFADSVKGQYFIEPQQIKTTMADFLNYKEVYPNSIPYIQHQNSSLTEELWMLHAEVDQEPLKFISKHLFADMPPDAQNFWMGFDQSVSSMHKDPYENFYTTISGQKHFTILPPMNVLYLEEQKFKKAKWSYDKQKGSFECKQVPDEQTVWITCNVDLQEDVKNQKAFPWLSKVNKYHVTLQKSQTLYLPSLWYHQVSQVSGKNPYTLAINYWFDMQYSQNYSLYEVCRKLKGI